jgi:hypothetical protein
VGHGLEIQNFGPKPQGKRHLGRSGSRWDDMKIYLREIRCIGLDWNELPLDMIEKQDFINIRINFPVS